MRPRNKAIREYWLDLAKNLKDDVDDFNKSRPDSKPWVRNEDGEYCFNFANEVTDVFKRQQTIDFLCFRFTWDDPTGDSGQVELNEGELFAEKRFPVKTYRIVLNNDRVAMLSGTDGVTPVRIEDVKALLQEYLKRSPRN
jgi:hypothetical protein